MIRHPIALIGVLAALEVAILALAARPTTRRFFKFLPSVFWIYFVPMILATAGVIDAGSPVYARLTRWLLPASLWLLLIGTDIKAIARIGRPALIMMTAGSVGIMAGTVAVFGVVHRWLGPEFWSGFGALSGSWMGGSANMIAVKEAIGTPEEIFLPMVVVDTICPYVWMGLLVGAAAGQSWFNRKIRADDRDLHRISAQLAETLSASKPKPLQPVTLGILILSAAVAGSLAAWAGQALPEINGIISATAWTIILISTAALAASLTPVRQLESLGASRVGYAVLYFVLTTIGARASLSAFGATGPLLAAGFLIILIQAGVLLITARVIRAPLALVATASQANIGGVASAPIVAEVYRPGLAPVGLLMAVLGNIAGTYLGILTARVCFWIVS